MMETCRRSSPARITTRHPYSSRPICCARPADKRVVPEIPVPEICVLDPDGDILRALQRTGRAARSPGWACYHTELYEFDHEGERFGIIGRAVGASFAVLLAEELFVSGCRFLVSVTSAGQIHPRGESPYFVLIDRALRDEGTSYHYLPPAEFAEADRLLAAATMRSLARHRGDSLSRRHLDHRRPLSRDRSGDRAGARSRHSRRRDGGGGALCLCRRRAASRCCASPT